MKNRATSLAILALTSFFGLASFMHNSPVIPFYVPEGWPKPHYNFEKNPLTASGIQLGRLLFYDPLLSADSTISCASCHLQATGFTHVDHALSHGIKGRVGTRNSMTIANLAWSTTFMWDGGVNHLDMQPLNPITSHEEMDESLAHVVAKLNASPKYRKRFQAACGDSTATGQHLFLALSQFLLTLQSYNSKYDQYMRHEPGIALTEQELNGLALFRTNCARCHAEPLFTQNNFARNGLPVDSTLLDYGRMRITGNAADSLIFKVPSLRNVQFTQPYMHDGRYKKLSQVLNYYAQNEPLGIHLTANEKVDLTAFLLTLTDFSFLFNPDFGFPKTDD